MGNFSPENAMNVKELHRLVREVEQSFFDAGVTAGRGMTRQLAVDLPYARKRRNELIEYLLAQATKDTAKEITETKSS